MGKRSKILILVAISLLIIVVLSDVVSLLSLASAPDFPSDTWLKDQEKRNALIIVAHDDDAVLFAGTTSKLAREGWDVSFLCFYAYSWRPEDNPTRKREMEKVAGIEGLKSLDLVDLEIRRRLDTVARPWMPVPYERFNDLFKIDSLRSYISSAIWRFRPDVIFMADSEIGFYGHPEHVVVGKTVLEVCNADLDSAGFTVRRIYQAVLPAGPAEKLMGAAETYKEGKRVYNVEGMPAPMVQLDISRYSATKMRILRAHSSQHRNIRKFFPSYRYYPGWIYFRIFGKEYFNVIDLQLPGGTN